MVLQNSSVAIADVDLEDRKDKLDTVQTLKTTKAKRKNSGQSSSAPRTKKLKADEESNKASSLERGGNCAETPSTSTMWESACKKEESEGDFTFGQSPVKKMKTEACPQGQPVRCLANANNIKEEVEMNWDIVQVCAAFFRHFSSFDSFLLTRVGVALAKERGGVFNSLSSLPVMPGGFGHWFLSWVCCFVL